MIWHKLNCVYACSYRRRFSRFTLLIMICNREREKQLAGSCMKTKIREEETTRIICVWYYCWQGGEM